MSAKVIWCFKGFCDGVKPIGYLYGGLYGLDSLLESKGHEPFFIPLLADYIVPDTEVTKTIKEQSNLQNKFQLEAEKLEEFKSEAKAVSNFQKSGYINDTEAKDWLELIKKNQGITEQNRSELFKKIKENLDSLNKPKE